MVTLVRRADSYDADPQPGVAPLGPYHWLKGEFGSKGSRAGEAVLDMDFGQEVHDVSEVTICASVFCFPTCFLIVRKIPFGCISLRSSNRGAISPSY